MHKRNIIKQTLIFGILLIITMGLNFSDTQIVINSELDRKDIYASQSSSLKVMTTINICQDVAQQIMGNLGTVQSIVAGSQDVHTFSGPTESQKIAMSQADIFFAMGLEDLEPWLQDTLDSLGANAPYIVYLVQECMIRYDPIIESDNPHVWLDPNNIKLMADNITRELSLLDPINQATFETNNATYGVELDNLLQRIAGNATILTGTKVVENHPAFMYLLDLLGMVRIDAIEKIEGAEPSSADIVNIINKMKAEDCKLLINPSFAEQKVVNEIANEVGAKIARCTPLITGNDQNGNVINSYIKMMDYNLWALNHPEEPPSIPGYSLITILGMIPFCFWILRTRIKIIFKDLTFFK